MAFPVYNPPPRGPNPYQIAGQAAMQLGSQVQEFGQNQDKMRMAFEDMVEKRRQRILDEQRAAEALRLQTEEAQRKADADRRALESEEKSRKVRSTVAERVGSGEPFTRQEEAQLYLAEGLEPPKNWVTQEPEKLSSEIEVGGVLYRRQPDGSLQPIVDNRRPQETTPLTTNEGVFLIDKETRTAIPVTGPDGAALGGKKAFSPEERAKAKGSFASSAASLARLRKEAEDIKKMSGLSFLTGGTGMLPVVPGTGPANARARLETLKSQSGFNVLQNMRDMSKTGGALGNVSNFEVQALQNNLTALDTKQSDDAFLASLDRLIEYTRDAEARLAAGYRDQYGEDAPSLAPESVRPQGGDTIPRPQTQAEYDALPSGSEYIGSDGKRKRKK